ncbi:MAG: bacterial Ig-like domain-containing protein [Clostridia bacterium]|nr:bacterial Ig-like domain-containing protein [Clostridia bacterium]
MIAIAVVLVVAIVIVGVVILTGDNNSGGENSGGTNDGGTTDGDYTEVPDEIKQFYISTTPLKTDYTVGDVANYSGLVVYLKSADGISMFINYNDDPDAFTITGFDSSKPAEEQVITVECRGFTDTFTIKIIENDVAHATLVGITVDPLPQTTYKVGESFKHTGGYIVAEYSDGTFETIKLRMKHVSGYGAIANTPGEHEITISYSDDHGGYAETTITVTITE